MDGAEVERLGLRLYRALVDGVTVPPLTQSHPDITVDDAYRVSSSLLARRLAAGERVVGKKIGVTSRAVQSMLGVYQPDFGVLTDAMQYADGSEIPIAGHLIQPRAEGEIAFVLGDSLCGPGVTEREVEGATAYVSPCFEIVDSRIEDWRIAIEDTVADNASCGVFVLGDHRVDPAAVDLETCGFVIEKNGEVVSTGAGAAALGSPLRAVAWLANTLGGYGVSLDPGDIVLSGSLVPLEPVAAGDVLTLRSGIGSARVSFA